MSDKIMLYAICHITDILILLSNITILFPKRLFDGEARLDEESDEDKQNAPCFPITSDYTISGDGGAPIILSNVLGLTCVSKRLRKQSRSTMHSWRKRNHCYKNSLVIRVIMHFDCDCIHGLVNIECIQPREKE